MSDGVNNVILQGELSWPELKYTNTGKALFKAKIKIPAGDNKSSYLRIVAWEEFAEYLNSLAPNSRVRVSARIQERSFQNKDGDKQISTDLVVDGVETVSSTDGANYFLLQGEIAWPELKQVGERQTSLFRSKVRIPYTKNDGSSGASYVRITAWDEMADGLGALGEGAYVQVSGHIQDRTWNTPTGQKKVFTDAVVTNFTTPEA